MEQIKPDQASEPCCQCPFLLSCLSTVSYMHVHEVLHSKSKTLLNLLRGKTFSIKRKKKQKKTDLFYHHTSKVSKNLIKIRDGLYNLLDVSLPLFHHYCVLLHQSKLVICKTLRESKGMCMTWKTKDTREKKAIVIHFYIPDHQGCFLL